jgi:hypothetical protein
MLAAAKVVGQSLESTILFSFLLSATLAALGVLAVR